jgi:hypothetical protein
MSGQIFCKNEQVRRAVLLKHPGLNGIDFLEVDAVDHRILRIFFLKPVEPANPLNPADPQDNLGLSKDPGKITILGGVRIVGIHAVSVTRHPDGSLEVHVDHAGDFSTYKLAIQSAALDPVLANVDFSFMAACPSDFDCRTETPCPPPALTEPVLDYLAKDYASFRRLMLDLLPTLNPQAKERNVADILIAHIELLAYHGDRWSSYQDAVGNEAFLEMVRQRTSARRHARLIDYGMHDGRNAWTWVHIAVKAPVPLPQGTMLVTRITSALGGDTGPPLVAMDAKKITIETLEGDPALRAVLVFETAFPAQLAPSNNEIFLHTWGNEECCMPTGTTEAFLYAAQGSTAIRPALKTGDWLLLEEVRGPLTGVKADASVAHRHMVLIDHDPQNTNDPLFSSTLIDGAPKEWATGDPTLPLLRVQWRRENALPFPLCVSSRTSGVGLIRNVSVARGNIVLADHGLTVMETLTRTEPVPEDANFRLQLSHAPLTMETQPPLVNYDAVTGRLATSRTSLEAGPRDARPAISLLATFPTGDELWTPVPDLLDSSPFDQNFVAEVNNDGIALLRFGDFEYGRGIAGAIKFRVVFRTGNGLRGNASAEAIFHVAATPPLTDVMLVRNPLAARGGVEPESIAQVRQRAPQAFRAEQFRAVTEADYVAAAKKLPTVSSAVASFRWTGSWYTVFVGVQPADPADLVRLPDGFTKLSPGLEQQVRGFLNTYRLAGYDLEIRAPRFVPLEIDMDLCVKSTYFRGDVAHALAQALSNGILPDGTSGFFHPSHFGFGQPVYISLIYAAIEQVAGVDSVVITRFRRFGQRDNGELASGLIHVGPWEIAQLDNDPNFMEHGILRISARGGKL